VKTRHPILRVKDAVWTRRVPVRLTRAAHKAESDFLMHQMSRLVKSSGAYRAGNAPPFERCTPPARRR